MALVICDMSISLDGYVTGPNDSRENPFGDGAGMLHDWMSTRPPTRTGPSCRICSTASGPS
jgi:hypothetical protein